MISEAIHVNQHGYRPDDPSKKAYISQWMGLGGAVSYDHIRTFSLLDEFGARVYDGMVRLNHSGEIVPFGSGELSSCAPVYALDFSGFDKLGTYRVFVPGIGCSSPFKISENRWDQALRASMNALYCQRSGIVTGPPYTQFSRPRCYHPDDGKIVYQSGCSLFESGNGIPDILNEACWNIDFYRRLQLPDGGIRGGIEQEEHPIFGQCGWQDNWKSYAYAPDFWTGLGVRAVRNILHHDSRLTGQEPPSGITVFGPQDFNHPDDAFPRLIRDDFLWPGAYVLPTVGGYLDIYRHPCVTEYTVQGTIGPAIYRFGYFAARKKV